MTHINEDRVIGNHADMGTPAAPLTPTEIVRGGMHRTTRRARPETPEKTDESTRNDEDAGTDG